MAKTITVPSNVDILESPSVLFAINSDIQVRSVGKETKGKGSDPRKVIAKAPRISARKMKKHMKEKKKRVMQMNSLL